ncbi:MAG: T9SS type A sorting domain-containing protein, partial [Paludibacter sp.]
ICSEQDCTRDFDNGWDGRKILGSYLTPQLFAMEADGNYQINAVDDINNTELGFIAGEDSSYTLTFTHSNLEKTYNRLFLQDLQNNDVVDITQSGTEYSFESPQNYTPTKRFKLITRAVLDKTEQNRMQVNLFSNNHTIYIHNLSSKSGNLLLYNLSGRIIKNLAFDANNVTVVKADLPSGGYIAKMTTEMGEMRKLLVLD